MLVIIVYKQKIKNKSEAIITRRNFWILNKFLKGDKIIKIRPAKLLIKNRG